MRIYITQLLFFILFSTSNITNAQNLFNKPSDLIEIKSPNVASFNKFIDNPISLYNGQPDVNIPIYTLKDGDIELPIDLRYNTSGIKLSEDASWVGLGWNLNVGGQISQNAIGALDFYPGDRYKSDFHKFMSEKFTSIFKTTETVKGFGYIAANWDLYSNYISSAVSGDEFYLKGVGKLEPDIFYFSYPGNSGKFVIDYSNKDMYVPVLLSKEQDLKIEYISSGFNITTTNGIKHVFQIRDGADGVYVDNSANLYTLKESIYPNGQKVIYEYEVVDTSIPTYRSQTIRYYSGGNLYYEDKNSYPNLDGNLPEPINKDLYLKSIKTNNYEIIFNINEREDIGKKLNSIEIRYQDYTIHKYIFNYDYWRSNQGLEITDDRRVWARSLEKNRKEITKWVNNRLKLLGFSETKDEKNYNSYKFHYNEEAIIPRKDSYAFDYWGYYNGNLNNTTSIPDIAHLFLYDTYDNEDIYTNALKRNVYDLCNRGLCFGDRRFSQKDAQLFMLKGIEYPTGGYLEYAYEPNEFDQLGVDHWQQGLSAGAPLLKVPAETQLRKPIIFSKDDNPQFSIKKTISLNHRPRELGTSESSYFSVDIEGISALLKYRIMRNPTMTWLDMSQISYKVEILKKDTKSGKYIVDKGFYTYDILNDEYQGSSTKVYENNNIILSKGEYCLQIQYPQILTNQQEGFIEAELTYFGERPTDQLPSSFKGCGLRINSIKLYDNIQDTSSTPLLETLYEYPLGMLHSVIDYAKITRKVRTTPNLKPIAIYPTDEIIILNKNMASISYGGINGVGYSWVKEIKKSDSGIGYTYYKFNNNKGVYKFRQGGIKIDPPLNGKLYEQTSYDKNGTLLKQDKYNYSFKKISTNSLWGISFTHTYGKGTDVIMDESVYYSQSLGIGNTDILIGDKNNYGDPVHIYKYDIPCYSVTLDSKESRIDGVTSKEEYLYNTQTLQLKETKTILGDNKSLINKYFYPNDYNCGIYKEMTDKYIISPIIETQTFRNGGYLGGSVTEYNWTKDKINIKPSKKYFSEVNNKIENPKTYNCSSINEIIFPTTNVEFKEYDSFGNLLLINKSGAEEVIYLWSYGGQYPIAEIKGGTYADVETVVKSAFGVSSIEALSQKVSVTISQLNNFQNHDLLKDALITTYTYQPLVGMMSMTDPRGVTTTYEYDSFGRLKTAKDADGKVVQTYDYHYQNQ